MGNYIDVSSSKSNTLRMFYGSGLGFSLNLPAVSRYMDDEKHGDGCVLVVVRPKPDGEVWVTDKNEHDVRQHVWRQNGKYAVIPGRWGSNDMLNVGPYKIMNDYVYHRHGVSANTEVTLIFAVELD